jgi:hypothetical protein
MPGFKHLPEDFGVVARMLADRGEGRLDALVGQRLEHGPGIVEPRPVVKGRAIRLWGLLSPHRRAPARYHTRSFSELFVHSGRYAAGASLPRSPAPDLERGAAG